MHVFVSYIVSHSDEIICKNNFPCCKFLSFEFQVGQNCNYFQKIQIRRCFLHFKESSNCSTIYSKHLHLTVTQFSSEERNSLHEPFNTYTWFLQIAVICFLSIRGKSSLRFISLPRCTCRECVLIFFQNELVMNTDIWGILLFSIQIHKANLVPVTNVLAPNPNGRFQTNPVDYE